MLLKLLFIYHKYNRRKMYSSKLSATIVACLSLSVALFSYLWNSKLFEYTNIAKPAEMLIVEAWEKLIKPAQSEISFEKVAVGVNGDVDLIVKGTELLLKLNTMANMSETKQVDHPSLQSIVDLQESFNLYHGKGAGCERFMENAQEFDKIIKISENLDSKKYYIGGNAALMAQKMAEVNGEIQIVLGAPVGPILKELLHPRLKTLDSTFVAQDEFHMILEYSKGERWNGVTCPAASRFIFSHDMSNARMSCLEDFVHSLHSFQPDLVVLSGLHLLESVRWQERLGEIVALVKSIPPRAVIHLELASMADRTFVTALIEQVLPVVDSVGLNEQELWLVCRSGGGPRCADSDSPPFPLDPAIVADILTWMLRGRLTRVHFHTLTHHIVASRAGSPWRNQAAAVASGAYLAVRQACAGAVAPADVELKLSGPIRRIGEPDLAFNPSDPVISWQADGTDFTLSPALLCRRPVRTVGLGDTISASGLLNSGFVR